MKAYWLENGEALTNEDLTKNGVEYEKIDTANYQPSLDRIKAKNNYVAQDIVEITPTMPNLDVLLAKFDKEHLHTDDEVRYVLSGGGIFDIRSIDDRWMRVEVYSGDYISVPKDRHHRFFCTQDNAIRCVRLFKDNSGWTPVYRPTKETASV